MTDLRLDPPEIHVVLAALALYEALMANCLEAGGDAAETAVFMAPIAERVSRRLRDAMYAPDLSAGDHYIGMPS